MRFLTSSLGRLRLLGFLEGLSFLILLGIAMPLKYVWGQPEAVRVVGMAHGVLFIAYLGATLQAMLELNWTLKRAAFLALASFLPGGTFFTDAIWLRPAKAAQVA